MNYARYRQQFYIHVFNAASPPAANREAELVSQFVPVTNIDKRSASVGYYTRKQQENLD
jgi:hypothetical protein